MMKNWVLTRRSFLWSGASFLGAWKLGWPYVLVAAEDPAFALSEMQRHSLENILKEMDGKYDSKEKMVTSSVSSVGYHTTLKDGIVHPTRTSLEYAVALLDSSESARLERAKEILERLIALQDQDPASKTYGIWSWYLEEPLDQMSPPDWNWADFCGVQLLAAWVDHRDRLGEDLANRVRDAIHHAANSIQKRNVSMGYTNIAIMGTYVTLVASDRFDLPDMQTYAKERLHLYHQYLLEQGSFTEYNSPTYTVVAIRELARMLMHVRDEEDLKWIREIHDLAWKHALIRFHVPTKQWAGPHSRSYSTLLHKDVLEFFEAATGLEGLVLQERPIELDLSTYRLTLQCPETCQSYLAPLTEPREITEIFMKSKEPEQSIIGTTWLHPHYALGSANTADFWNQRRPLVAYWGTADRPSYLQVRFLHDGYDYCSAIPYTLQHQGCALTGVVFATDYGDTHPSLDRVKNGTIRAKDLRLRFEFGGDLSGLSFEPVADHAGMMQMKDREMRMRLRPVIDWFGEGRCRWEYGGDSEKKWIDAVAWSGDEKEINFTQLKQALFVVALQIYSSKDEPGTMDRIAMNQEKGRCGVRWESLMKKNLDVGVAEYQVTYQLEFPLQPASASELRNSVLHNLTVMSE